MVVRKRKWAPSNTSSEAYDENGFQSIELYRASIDRNRQAPGNKIPMPWPFYRAPGSAQGDAIVARIEGNMRKVLRENQISIERFDVFFLARKGLQTPKRETLVIQTSDDQSETVGISTWWYAATDIQALLDEEVRQSKCTRAIRVEIRNSDLMDQNISSVVPAGPAYDLLTRMREDVIQRIRSLNCPGVGPISFVMRGSKNGVQNPTVLVGVTPGSISNWQFCYNRITEVIESYSSSMVGLEFLPEIVQSAVSLEYQLAQPQIYKTIDLLPPTAFIGSSIGARGSQNAGSLGTKQYALETVSLPPKTSRICKLTPMISQWIWLKEPGKVRKMAFLTCYHVIRTGEANKAARLQNDKHGIGLQGRPITAPIIVDYPAPFDGIATEKFLTAEISHGKLNGSVNQIILDTITRYRKYPGIGEVVYASGDRKKNNSGKSMDWAIVVLPSPGPKSGQNFAPHERSLARLTQTNGETNFDYFVQPNEVVSIVGEPLLDGWGVKTGRTTGTTTGNFGKIEANVPQTHEDGTTILTNEYQIISFGGQLMALGGDSGSMVINQNKEWVGMITQACTSDSAAYFTCAQDIIDDIKDKTGCDITLPK